MEYFPDMEYFQYEDNYLKIQASLHIRTNKNAGNNDHTAPKMLYLWL